MKNFSINERAILAFFHDAIMLMISWTVALSLFSHTATAPYSGGFLASLAAYKRNNHRVHIKEPIIVLNGLHHKLPNSLMMT